MYAGFAMPVAESSGEPWRSAFMPAGMERLPVENGFEALEQLGRRDCVERSRRQRSDALQPIGLWMLARAVRRVR